MTVRDRVSAAGAMRPREPPPGAGRRRPRPACRAQKAAAWSGAMPPGEASPRGAGPGPAHTERAAGIRFWSPRPRSRDPKRKLMANGLYRGLAMSWRDTAGAAPAALEEPGPAAGGQGTNQAGPRPRPGPDSSPCPLTWPRAGLPPLRTRPAALAPRQVPATSRSALSRPGSGSPGARRPASRPLAGTGTPGHFPSHRNRPILGPVQLCPDWKIRPAEKRQAAIAISK